MASFGKYLKILPCQQEQKEKRARELCISGMTVGNGEHICPFRQLKPPMLPKKVRSRFKTEWQSILKKMAAVPGMSLPNNVEGINATVIDTTFLIATSHLKGICSFFVGEGKEYY